MTKGLNLQVLTEANIARIPEFRNAKGEICHSEDGSSWSLAQWCNATLGELGEAANVIKKIDRGDLTLEEARENLGKEIADTLTYLTILAYRADIDLSKATIDKWNEISDRIGSNLVLEHDRYYRTL